MRAVRFSQRYNGVTRSCAMRRRVFGRVFPDVSEYSIAFTFTTERSSNVGNTCLRNVLFRSMVLPSHSRPRDPLMWAIRAFEMSGTIYSMTQRHSLKLPLLMRCRKVSSDPHYIFRCLWPNKLLKQIVPSFVDSVSLYVVLQASWLYIILLDGRRKLHLHAEATYLSVVKG